MSEASLRFRRPSHVDGGRLKFTGGVGWRGVGDGRADMLSLLGAEGFPKVYATTLRA